MSHTPRKELPWWHDMAPNETWRAIRDGTMSLAQFRLWHARETRKERSKAYDEGWNEGWNSQD